MDMDLAKTPARAPPPGQVNNLIDPSSVAYQVTVCNAACAVVVLTVVGLRMYTRVFLTRSVGRDDCKYLDTGQLGLSWLSMTVSDVNLFALVCWISTFIIFQTMGQYGLGTHLWNVSLANFSPNFLRGWTVAAILYSATMLFIKLSILVLYRRLFPIDNFAIRWWVVVIFTVGYSVAGILSSLFACTPVAATW